MATVSVGARLHFGFQNLSLARERLYGGLGVALERPRVTVRAEPAKTVRAEPTLEGYASRTVDVLGVPGVTLTLEESLPRHVGLGSGTQLALSVLLATARAYGREVNVRRHAPALGRGGRSGIGVGAFEDGGFIVDAGHPTSRFTTAPPADGDWTVPPVVARHHLPARWRFLVVLPDAPPGRSGEDEDTSMRTVVERADPAVADEIASVLTHRLLPAAAEGRLEAFGDGIERIGRLNGQWYTDTQGGVYRPPAGALIDGLAECPVLSGVGQSSWGPAVYGVTDIDHVAEARRAARNVLEETGIGGEVVVTPVATGGRQCHNR